MALRGIALAAALALPGAPAAEEVHVLGFGALDQAGSPAMRSELGHGVAAPALSAQLFHGRPLRVLGIREWNRPGLLEHTPGFESYTPDDPRSKLSPKKVILLQRAVERLPPDDFVLYMDATDAFLQRPTSELPSRYFALLADRVARGAAAIEKGQEPVLINGVVTCWPLQDWSDAPSVRTPSDLHRPDRRYGVRGGLLGRELCPQYNASFRALDGPATFPEPGLWFGRARSARRMLSSAAAALAADGEDQEQVALVLARLADPSLFVVDGRAEVLWAAEVRLWNPCGLFGRGPFHFGPSGLQSDSKAARDFLREVGPPSLCGEGYFRPEAGWLPPPLRGGRGPPTAVHLPGCVKRAVMGSCFRALVALARARGELGPAEETPQVLYHDEDAAVGMAISLD